MKKILCLILFFTTSFSWSQTIPFITEFRGQLGDSKFEVRARPVFYFMNNQNARQEFFLGYSFTKNIKLFSYSRYNEYQSTLYTGFRFDHKLWVKNFSLNNQFRYLNNLNKSLSDVIIYIPDLMYNTKKVKLGMRGFITFSNSAGAGFENRKAYVGPAAIIGFKHFTLFTTYLPDHHSFSNDYLMMFLFIINIKSWIQLRKNSFCS